MNILVIVAHPDDEVLGCGGTIARHISNGDIVDVLIISDGVTARYNKYDYRRDNVIDEIKDIRNNSHNALTFLKVNSYEIIGLDPNRLDTYPLLEITKLIEDKIMKCCPDIIYTHHPNDVNNDHIIIFKAVQSATRPMNNLSIKKVLLMEILSSNEWDFTNQIIYDTYVDISEFIEMKKHSMELYSTELRYPPHPRSIEGIENLAKKRGFEVGLKYAEAFKLLREIV